jgi:hypothetical protein
MPANVKERRGRPAAAKPAGSSRLSRKNQVTIPVAVLRTANIKPGDLRRWQSRFADVVGTLPGFESDVDVEASRDQWG